MHSRRLELKLDCRGQDPLTYQGCYPIAMKPAPSVTIKPRVLFVDDEHKTCKYFVRCFSDRYEVLLANSLAEAQSILSETPEVAVIVCDQRMPEGKGIDLLQHAREEYPNIVRVISTAYSDYDVVVDAINSASVFGYIDKPWDLDRLAVLLARGVEYYTAGNSSDGLIPSTTELAIKNRIEFDIKALHDLETMLRLIHSISATDREPGRQGTFAIAQFGEELLIGHRTNGSEDEKLLSLSEFREKARSISGAAKGADIFTRIFGETEAPSENAISESPHRLLSAVEPNTTGGAFSGERNTLENRVLAKPSKITISQRIQIQKSADEIIVHLTDLIRGIERGGGIRPRSSRLLREQVDGIEKMLKSFQIISESEAFDEKMVEEAKVALYILLEPLVFGRPPLRAYIAKGLVSERSVTGLFVSYNTVASFFGSVRCHPDPTMMMLCRQSGDKSGNRIFVIMASVMSILPLLGLLFFGGNGQLLTRGTEKILQFLVILGSSILSGFLAKVCLGKMSMNAKLRVLGDKDNDVSLAATGGYATFAFILILGSWVMFF